MWKALAGVLIAAVSGSAQSWRSSELRERKHIEGTVLDQRGAPIADASIDDAARWAHRTDSAGRFDIETKTPVFVIRKEGFQSERVRILDATMLRVTLRRLEEKRSLPVCSEEKTLGITDRSTGLRFPKIANVRASRQGHDVDYSARNYYVKTPRGAKGILHGKGRSWSWGIPNDSEVWQSVEYTEVEYDQGGFGIIDARGKFANGNRWRYLGMLGESASYSDVDPESAKILDQVLDGACFQPWHP